MMCTEKTASKKTNKEVVAAEAVTKTYLNNSSEVVVASIMEEVSTGMVSQEEKNSKIFSKTQM